MVEEGLERVDGQAPSVARREVEESAIGGLDSKGAPEVSEDKSRVLTISLRWRVSICILTRWRMF